MSRAGLFVLCAGMLCIICSIFYAVHDPIQVRLSFALQGIGFLVSLIGILLRVVGVLHNKLNLSAERD